jgi:hypothetical protein
MNRYDKYVPTQPGQPRSSLYGAPQTRKAGGIIHADKFGTDLQMRSAVPPPVAEYDEYLRRRNLRFRSPNHGTQISGFRLRRIVVMRREGMTWKECGEAVGVSGRTAKSWVEFLPMALAV